MNKIYKLVWSKAKQMYVAVAEIAKSRSKNSKRNVFSKTLVASVLACILSCGFSVNSYAYDVLYAGDHNNYNALSL